MFSLFSDIFSWNFNSIIDFNIPMTAILWHFLITSEEEKNICQCVKYILFQLNGCTCKNSFRLHHKVESTTQMSLLPESNVQGDNCHEDNPDVNQQLLLQAGDVETNPGPTHREGKELIDQLLCSSL